MSLQVLFLAKGFEAILAVERAYTSVREDMGCHGGVISVYLAAIDAFELLISSFGNIV